MILLCMDGLDYQLSAKLKLHLPYEATPTIEKELCALLDNNYVPHTLHVWPSMFAGRPIRHPDIDKLIIHPIRAKGRATLHRLGINWGRKETQLRAYQKGIIYQRSVKPEETVFGEYPSFIYQIPGLVDNFLLGGTDDWYNYEHNVWRNLIRIADKLPYKLVAVYTRQPDHLGHRKRNPAVIYREGFMLAKQLEGDVMILSDHGCDYHTGNHTMNGYIGANFPFKAESIMDVKKIIEDRLKLNNSEVKVAAEAEIKREV